MKRSIAASVALLLLALGAPAVEERPAVPMGEFLRGGTVEKWKGRRLRVSYDLAKPAALSDFQAITPFLAQPSGGFEVAEGALNGKGVSALCHRVVFETDVEVRATLSSPTPRDIGVLLVKPGLEQLLLFSLNDTYYLSRDKEAFPRHMITVVGAEDGGPADAVLFRYLVRAAKPELAANAPIEVEVIKKAERNRFTLAGVSMDAADRYGKFTEVQPALFVLESEMTVTALSISGKVSERFLKEKRIAWDPAEVDDEAVKEIEPPKGEMVPVEPPAPPTGRTGGRGGPGGWNPFGGTETGAAIGKIKDTSLSEQDRRAAAATLTKENVKAAEFRLLIDCLYSGDLLTRTLAIETLKRITGKTLGYDPKAPEPARKDAVRNWFKYLADNRDRLR